MTRIVPVPANLLKERLLDWATTSPQYPYFKGSSQDLASWFATVERACEANEIPDIQFADAAIVLIEGDLAHVMEERKLKYLEKSGDTFWRWEEFKDDIRRVIQEAEKIMADNAATPLDKTKAAFANLRNEHPYVFASAGTCLMVGGSFVIIPALGVLALNAIGFTSAGVAGGSLAAMLQSVFYRGATYGLFSMLQSAGATAVLPAAGSIVGATSAVGAGIASLIYGTKQEPEEAPSNPPNSPPPAYQESPAPTPPANYAVYQSRRNRRT